MNWEVYLIQTLFDIELTKNWILHFQNAEFHEVGPDLKNILKSGETGKCDYVAIRGAVKSIGEPIQSVNNENVKGVVQRLCVKEHVIARCTSGFWYVFKKSNLIAIICVFLEIIITQKHFRNKI